MTTGMIFASHAHRRACDARVRRSLPECGAVFGFEVSLQSQASVAAVPQPQLPGSGARPGSSRGSGPSGSTWFRMCWPIRCSDVELNDRA
jgi:hypothetical protein